MSSLVRRAWMTMQAVGRRLLGPRGDGSSAAQPSVRRWFGLGMFALGAGLAVNTVVEQELDGDASVLALAIAVSGDPTKTAARYISSDGDTAGRLTTIGVPEPSQGNLSTGPDLVRLALDVKRYLQDLDPRPKRILLFYWGPLTGAVFIGHQLNATVPEIQLFEEDHGVYSPSMTLT